MPLHACTIVARNYLPHARVLARSFLASNPGSRFTTLVIDDRGREVGADEPFELLHLDELLPRTDELHLLATYYDVMELATAVKPLLLLHLLRGTRDAVCYIDPDIEVYDQLTTVEQAAEQAPIVLTPHTMVPYPRDGLRPTEAEIMGAGIYNLGFIGVRAGSEPFLRWWWERLQRDAVVDPAKMLFTDQRWIDFVPSLFDHVLVKDPGLNVAYWNLHGRELARTEAGVRVDGGPLRFFHYSGYSPYRAAALSKHTGDHPRVRLEDDPVLAELAGAYGRRLVEAGLPASGGAAYGWGAERGVPLDAAMRRAYQTGVRACESQGLPLPPNPFDSGPEAFLDWLAQPQSGRTWPKVNRYLYALYDVREDLQRHFPESERAAAAAYREWAAAGGVPRTPGIERVLDSATSTSAPLGLPSVQVVGYFKAELGMGEYGRQLVDAVRAAGGPVGTTTWTETVSRQQHPFEDAVAAASPRVNLLVVNADQTPVLLQAAGPDFVAGRYTIGAWAWEVEEFPAEHASSLDLVDEVWAISDFARDAIARRTTKPVLSVPPPVSVPVVDAGTTRADLDLPSDAYLFLFSFDYLSIPRRKNAVGLVEAFCTAFRPGEGPVLVIKSINGDTVPEHRDALRALVAGRSDIVLLERYLTPAQRGSLVSLCDCYVSLHRSEGLGLTMAEAMALGKPVIATAYSGNMTFMDAGNSYLVPYDLVPVGEGAAPYPPTARWAEPRVDEAAALLRQVWSDPEAAARVGQQAAADIRAKHSAEARSHLVEERLRALQELLPPADDERLPAHGLERIELGALQRGVHRARFLAHVARSPELRRAALRRRLGSAISAGFGQSRRAVAEQEAMRREMVALRSQVELVTQGIDQFSQQQRQDPHERALAELRHELEQVRSREEVVEGQLSVLERRLTQSVAGAPGVPGPVTAQDAATDTAAAPTDPALVPVPDDPEPGVSVQVPARP